MELKKEKDIFYFEEDGVEIAEMTFSLAGDTMLIIDHTDVRESHKGQGLGKKLLYEVVAYARENDREIIPLCPFSKAMFNKDESIRDVLKK